MNRKMDMLNADLSLSNDVQTSHSRKKYANKKKKNKKKTAREDEDEAGFHFVAFMPIRGSVWKLDGLEQQPTNLGEFWAVCGDCMG